MNRAVEERIRVAVCEVIGLEPDDLWKMRKFTLHALARGCFLQVATGAYPYRIVDVAVHVGCNRNMLTKARLSVVDLAQRGNQPIRRALADIARELGIDAAEITPPLLGYGDAADEAAEGRRAA